jgi:serine/threonine-protein kinase
MAAWNPRANEIFAAALEMSGAKRQALIEESCGADSELRGQVEAMLSAHAEAGSFLDQPIGGEMLTTAEVTPSSGPPLPATGSVVQALADQPAELPARYQVEEEIARGGMGAVLRGRDTELKREIAVKVLLETHAGRTEFVQRFVEEAQIAGQLQHPGIAPVYDVGTATGKRPYFTMKLVKGQTLAKLLTERPVGHVCNVPDEKEARCKRAPRDLPRLLKIFEAVCQTLAYAHAHSVIHRDLKPSNVMVGAFGEVQVMDWGLAKVLTSRDREGAEEEANTVIASARSEDGDSGQTQAGTAMGTPAYMAPEQARGEVERIDERADVFGLGAVLCEILTGQPPFPGKSSEAMRKAKKGDLADAFTRLAGCTADAELIALAKSSLAAEPEDRPRSAGEVAERMTAYLESVEARLRKAELERAQAQVKAIEERKRRRLALALAASVLLTVLLGGGGYGWTQQQRAARRADTARKVDEALEKAAVLRGKAAAAGSDLSSWTEALAEAQRAQDWIDQGGAEPALRERVAAVQEELKRGRAQAEERARDAEAERRLVARLEAIHGEPNAQLNARWADRAYAEAFRAFGLDLDACTPGEAAARLAGRSATAEIAAALDEWATLGRLKLPESHSDQSWRRLVETARRADPDAWRNEIRATFGRPRAEVASILKKAADATELEHQPAVSLVLLARTLKGLGERERQAAVLRAAWRRFPGDFWVNFDLANSSWSTDYFERLDEAVNFLTAAVAARPGSAIAHNHLGIALHQQGRTDEAIACYHRAITLDEKLPDAHNNLGTVLYKQGKTDEAIAAYREAIRLDPKFAPARGNLANVLAKQGKLDQAIAEYRRIIQLDPTPAMAHYNLGHLLRRQGKIDEAIASQRRAIRLDPRFVQAHLSLGAMLCDVKHDYASAIVEFRQALRLDVKNAEAYMNLGVALLNQGKRDEAIAAFRQAIVLDPKRPTYHKGLGNALYHQGKLAEAVAAYRQTIALAPADAAAHSNLGNALYDQGKLDDAIVEYRQAIKVDPKFAAAWSNLGRLLARQRKLDDAIDAYRQAILLDPKNAPFYYNLGLALTTKGKTDDAIDAHRQAIVLDPKMAQAHCDLGLVLRLQGRLAESLESLRRGHTLGVKQPGWALPSGKWARETEALVLLEKNLLDVLAGKRVPVSAAEWIQYAKVCTLTRRNQAAAQLYAQAFALDPKLIEDVPAAHRYNAACCAAQASAARGIDAAGLSEKERARWRRQALTWLRADVTRIGKVIANGSPARRAGLQQGLRTGLSNPNLACVRDQKELAKLPAEERQAWQQFWADVEKLVENPPQKTK